MSEGSDLAAKMANHRATVASAFSGSRATVNQFWLGVGTRIRATALRTTSFLSATGLRSLIALVIRRGLRPEDMRRVAHLVSILWSRQGTNRASDRQAVADSIVSDPAALFVISGFAASSGDANWALKAVASLPPALQLQGAIWIGNQPTLVDHLPEIIYRGLTLEGPSALGLEQTNLQISLIPRVSAGFTDHQASAIALFLWRLSVTTPDPYQRTSYRSTASASLVRMAGANPVAEELLIKKANTPGEGRRPAALKLLARSVRAREDDPAKHFVRVAKLVNIKASEKEAFSRDADLTDRLAPRRPPRPFDLLRVRLRTLNGLLLAALMLVHPIAIWATFSANSTRVLDFPWTVAKSAIGVEAAVALLALIATINVFTVQLSTTRLPGTIARVSGQPAALLGAYASAGTLLAITTLSSAGPAAARDSVLVVLLGLTLAWIGFALSRIFKRTDPSQAVEEYIRRGMGRWTRAGRRLGRLQRRAAQDSRSLESLPGARIASDAEILGHDVITLRIPRRGFFLPRRSRLRKFLSLRAFTAGADLTLTSGLGQVVSSNQRVAALTTGSSGARRSLERSARRALLRPVSSRSIEDVSTQVVTLASLAVQSAESGDTRLADAIATQAAQIVHGHLASARSARRHLAGSRDDGLRDGFKPTLYPVAPILRDIVEFAVSRAASSPAAGKSIDILMERCFDACDDDDQFPLIVISSLDSEKVGRDRAAHWLLLAGMACLRQGQDSSFEMAVIRLGRLRSIDKHHLPALRTFAALCSASARLRSSQFTCAWDALLGTLGSERDDAEHRAIMHIGAASLRAGSFSALAAAASEFEGSSQRAWLNDHTDLNNVFGEAMMAQLSHIDLGPVPTDSLELFRDFVILE